MALTVAYSGVDGKVISDGTDMDVKQYDVKVADPGFEASTTAGEGWTDKLDALRTVSGSFDFFFNVAKNPFGAVMKWFTRGPNKYPLLIFQLGGSEVGTPAMSGMAKILEVTVKSVVTEGITFTATFESRGTWTLP